MLGSAIKQLLMANKKRGQLVAEALILNQTIDEKDKEKVANVVTNLLNSGLEEVNQEED